METVEIASTLPTAVTSTGSVFCETLPTLIVVGGRAGGAACGLVHPEISAIAINKMAGLVPFHPDRAQF
jgi:hypothetical protein